jgi:type VI protein secretion system component Hcp
VDKSSPALLKLCVNGDHVDEATLFCAKSVGQKNPEDFLQIILKEVYVSSFQAGGSHGEDVGTESVSITYGKIQYGYKIQQKDGSLVDGGTVLYDLVAREQG